MTNLIRTPIISPALGRDAVAGAPAPFPVVPVTRRSNRVALVVLGSTFAVVAGCSDPTVSRTPSLRLFPDYGLATIDDLPLPRELLRTTGDTVDSRIIGQSRIEFLLFPGAPAGFVQANGFDYTIVGGVVTDSVYLWDSWTFVGYASGNKLIAVADSNSEFPGDTTIFTEKGDSLIGRVEFFGGGKRRMAYIPVGF